MKMRGCIIPISLITPRPMGLLPVSAAPLVTLSPVLPASDDANLLSDPRTHRALSNPAPVLSAWNTLHLAHHLHILQISHSSHPLKENFPTPAHGEGRLIT